MSHTNPGETGSLHDRLRFDLTAAMREKDTVRTSTIRMALTAVRAEETSGSATRDLGDDDVLTVLGREAKKRREAAAAFDEAGRVEQADQERVELRILQEYLPAGLTDEELSTIVTDEVAAVLATGTPAAAAMGAVMKAVRPRVAQRADGARVAAAVRAALAERTPEG
jgi:uncharacterized protein YqeY